MAPENKDKSSPELILQWRAGRKRGILKTSFMNKAMNTEQKKVLLVEDDKFLSSLLKNRLEKSGIQTFHATDGEGALEIMRREHPSLILLDIILPKKTGFEVLEEIQADPALKGAQVMVISNLGQDDDVSRGKELGAIEYFVKAQTSIDTLVERIVAHTA